MDPIDVWRDEFRPVADTGIDARELKGTGLSPEDFELLPGWLPGPERVGRVASGSWPPFHPDDRSRELVPPPGMNRR